MLEKLPQRPDIKNLPESISVVQDWLQLDGSETIPLDEPTREQLHIEIMMAKQDRETAGENTTTLEQIRTRVHEIILRIRSAVYERYMQEAKEIIQRLSTTDDIGTSDRKFIQEEVLPRLAMPTEEQRTYLFTGKESGEPRISSGQLLLDLRRLENTTDEKTMLYVDKVRWDQKQGKAEKASDFERLKELMRLMLDLDPAAKGLALVHYAKPKTYESEQVMKKTLRSTVTLGASALAAISAWTRLDSLPTLAYSAIALWGSGFLEKSKNIKNMIDSEAYALTRDYMDGSDAGLARALRGKKKMDDVKKGFSEIVKESKTKTLTDAEMTSKLRTIGSDHLYLQHGTLERFVTMCRDIYTTRGDFGPVKGIIGHIRGLTSKEADLFLASLGDRRDLDAPSPTTPSSSALSGTPPAHPPLG